MHWFGLKDNNMWKNKKTGELYRIEAFITNTTNAQDGQRMVLYYKERNEYTMFAREENEFYEKFIYTG